MKARVVRAWIATDTLSVARPASARHRQRRLWLCCLLFSSIAAAVFGLSGLALSAVSLFHLVPSHGVMSESATILLTLAFFLLFLVGHCLDRLASFDRETREEIYRQKLRKILGN